MEKISPSSVETFAAPAPNTGGLFGAPGEKSISSFRGCDSKVAYLTNARAKSNASGLFGATSTSAPAPSGGGFGLSAPAPATGGSLFGGTPAPAPAGKTVWQRHVAGHSF